MALAKDRRTQEIIGASSLEYTDNHHQLSYWGASSNIISRSNSLSSPSSTNSSGLHNNSYNAINNNYEAEAAAGHSVISFRSGFENYFVNADGSLLSFDDNDDCGGSYSNVRLLEKFNTAASSTLKDNNFGWLHSEDNSTFDNIDRHELHTEEAQCFHKRPHTGESMQTLKKQCTSASRKPKPKASNLSSKDPQSIAAKNRRERISERLKILQELVPNGSKVDLVTMLEKAISYVKFLQLQVKVLATDELWPVQGGKAPELSQVKDAIDAILASQRHSNSTSN